MTSKINVYLLFFLFILNINPAKGNNVSETDSHLSKEQYSLPAVDRTLIEKELQVSKSGIVTIDLLMQLAEFDVKWEGNYRSADSLLNKGIEIAQLSYEPKQLLHAYSNYLMVIDDYHYMDRVKEVIAQLKSISVQVKDQADVWKSKLALAKGYQLTFQMDDARDLAYQSLTIAIQSEDKEMEAKSHLVLGNIHREMNNSIEAIRNLLDALTIAESERNVTLRMECYNELSTFYNLFKAYDKSINYKLKELDLAEHASNPDSVRIMNLKFDLEVIAFNNRTVNEKQLYMILDFADRHHITKLKRFGLVAFRNHLIKQNDLAQLYHLFHDEYPDELANIKLNDTITYYRMQALFYEYKAQYDSATIYYEMASSRINLSPDKLRQVSFYLRYGDFLVRRDKPEAAIEKYIYSYTLAASIPYYEFMLEATGKLEKIYQSQGDYANAYKFISITRNITDSLQSMEQKEQLQLMELENEETLREQKLVQEQKERQRRNNIQYTAITIVLATVFIVLAVLGAFRVSPTLIRMAGFLCFLFFFEFLILLFDTWIHHLTNGEPWKILAIKILLMCGLLPLHHMIEKRVTHFLINHNIQLFKKKVSPLEEVLPVANAEETNH